MQVDGGRTTKNGGPAKGLTHFLLCSGHKVRFGAKCLPPCLTIFVCVYSHV
jgi:hypothetical protein